MRLLEGIEKKGATLSKKYSMDSSLEEMDEIWEAVKKKAQAWLETWAFSLFYKYELILQALIDSDE